MTYHRSPIAFWGRPPEAAGAAGLHFGAATIRLPATHQQRSNSAAATRARRGQAPPKPPSGPGHDLGPNKQSLASQQPQPSAGSMELLFPAAQAGGRCCSATLWRAAHFAEVVSLGIWFCAPVSRNVDPPNPILVYSQSCTTWAPNPHTPRPRAAQNSTAQGSQVAQPHPRRAQTGAAPPLQRQAVQIRLLHPGGFCGFRPSKLPSSLPAAPQSQQDLCSQSWIQAHAEGAIPHSHHGVIP